MSSKGDELETVKQMIEVDGNKKKMKMNLSKARGGKPVLIKSIHNVQAKVQSVKHVTPADELQKIFDVLCDIPGAKVRFITNEENEFIGIFFQDERMQHLFSKYPEVILYDTTYKLNNKNMPLFTQLVINGNGQTEVANLFICKSESREGIGAMLDVFKEFNPEWSKTEVVIGDKDFADRSIYKEKFPQTSLQICLYHVLVIFHREITTKKREISEAQRIIVLEILVRLVYSKSAAEYDLLYEELCDLELELVTKYYVDNWHVIRDEWTLHGRNKFSNYLNDTNNRSERLNRTLKEIGNRYANLLIFFENVTTSLAVIASEKDITAVRSTMRVERKRFQEPALEQYHQLLTPFIFKKIEIEFELRKKVQIVKKSNRNSVFHTQSGYLATEESCTCNFFSAMKLPCKHIFKFLELSELDMYAPALCSVRWSKEYYHKSHPALSAYEHINIVEPISVRQVRVPSEIDKYKKMSNVSKDIFNVGASMSTGQYQYYMEKMDALRKEMINGSPIETGSISAGQVATTSNANLTISSPVASISHSIVPNPVASTSHTIVPNSVASSSNSNVLNDNPVTSPSTEDAGVRISSTQDQPKKPKSDVALMKLPPKISPIGRPKGSGQTVIGLKRKTNDKSKSQATPPKRKFIDLDKAEQAIKIVHWLTNKTPLEVKSRKVKYGDIIQDPTVFNRLRNDGLPFESIKKLVDSRCYTYLRDEIDKLQGKHWNCVKCNKNLKGTQLMCNGCLDWFHISCTEFKSSKQIDNVTYFCISCKSSNE